MILIKNTPLFYIKTLHSLKKLINGVAYDFELGTVNESDADYISASFFVGKNDSADLCNPFEMVGRMSEQMLAITFPAKVGIHNLGEMIGTERATSLALINATAQHISLCGKVEITLITDEKIEGKVVAENFGENRELSNDLYRADGTFIIQKCA